MSNGQYHFCRFYGKVTASYDEETEEYIGDQEILSGKIADLTKTAKNPEGISLFRDKDKTEFKSTTELLRDISTIYNDLTDKQQASLLEALAGKRQGQVVAAILNNFGTVDKALESMKNSAGSAEREMEIVSESVTFKLNALRETGVGIAQNIFDKEGIGVIIDGLTSVLELVDKFTEGAGLFGTLGAGAGIFGIVEIFKHLGGIKDFLGATAGLKTLGDFAAAGSLGFESMAGAIGVTTAALGTLIGVGGGIAALIAIIDACSTSFDEMKSAASKARDSYNETQSNIKSLNDELKTTQDRIAELEGKGKLELSEQQELDRLKRENEQLEHQIKLQEKLAEYQGRDAANKARDVFDKADEKTGKVLIDEYNKNQSKLSQLQGREDELIARMSNYSAKDMDENASVWNLTEGQKAYRADKAELEKVQSDIESVTSDLAEASSTMAQNYDSLFKTNGEVYEGCLDTVRRYNEALLYSGTETEQAAQKQQALNNILQDDAYEKPVEALRKYIEESGETELSLERIQEAFGNDETFDKFEQSLAEAGLSLADFQYSMGGFGDRILGTAWQAEDAISHLGDLYKSILSNDYSQANLTSESGLLSTIDMMNEIKASPQVDLADVENANKVIAYCLRQLQELNQPAIMSIDTTGMSDAQKKLVDLLQEFHTVQNERDIQVSIGADTSETDAKLEELRGKIAGASSELDISADVDTSTVDGVRSALENNKFNIQLVPQTAEIPDMSQTADLIYKNKVEKLPDQTASGTIAWKNQVSKPKVNDINRNIIYTYKLKGNKPSGGRVVKVNGTAHAYGTAFAGGSWGATHGGRALVGELGTEIRVNSQTGRWETVGDDGAEFINLNPNDIIFNHLQTASLLSNGYAIGRGTALAGGTAFASGLAYKKGRNSKKKKTSALEKFQNWFDKFFDWIEIRLERHAKKIERITKRAEYNADRGNYGSAASGYTSAINKSITQMRYQNTAASKYNGKANAVLNRAVRKGLITKKQANRIRNGVEDGSLKISRYGKKMQEVIKDFKEFYDKAQDAKDAIQELREQILSYIKSLKDLRDAQRDAKVEMSETYSKIATGGLNANASFASSQLLARNRQLRAQQNAYEANVTNLTGDLGKQVSSAKSSASKSITSALKKVKSVKKNGKKLTKKQREAYKKALNNAQSYVKKGEKIPNKVLNVIKKYNTSVYNKLYAYNQNIEINGDIEDILQEARLEAAQNYSETSAEIFKNQIESTSTLNDRQSALIDQYSKQAGAADTAAEKNALLLKSASRYTNIVSNSRDLVNDLTNQLATFRSSVSGTSAIAKTASDTKTREKVNEAVDKAKNAARSGKVINANVLADIAKYYGEGYISYDFYKACIDYNNAFNALEQAKDQYIIDEATAKMEREALGQERLENVQKEYANQQELIRSQQDIKTTRGVTLTASDYQALINSTSAEIAAKKRTIDENMRNGLWTSSSQAYKDAMVQLNELTKSQEEYNNSLAQLPYDTLDKAMERLDAIEKYYESIISMNSQLDKDSSEGDYLSQIGMNTAKLAKAEEQAAQALNDYRKAMSSVDKVYGGKTAEEWEAAYYGYLADVNSLQSEIDKLRDSLRDDVYWRTFERMHDAVERTQDTLEGIAKLIDNDMLFDKNGGLTEYGITKVGLLTKQFETARKEVANYSNDIKNLNDLYARGLYTELEYEEKLSDLQKNLLNSASDMKSYIMDIREMYKDMDQKELDTLNELIDKRKDALRKKKE